MNKDKSDNLNTEAGSYKSERFLYINGKEKRYTCSKQRTTPRILY